MARIVKAKDAPSDLVGVTLGQLTLEADQLPYETNDPSVLSVARSNPAVDVEEDEVTPTETAAEVSDPLDPHRNPAADHLSAFASEDAIKAAQENDAAIREVVSPYQNLADPATPTVEETVSATFDAVGVDAAPVFASAETPAVNPVAPEEPAAEVTKPTWSEDN